MQRTIVMRLLGPAGGGVFGYPDLWHSFLSGIHTCAIFTYLIMQ